MRVFSGLLFLVAPFAVAQTASPITDAGPVDSSTGLYAEVGAGGGYGGSQTGAIVGGRVALGYRLPSGISVGGHLTGYQIGNDYTGLSFGPEVRYSRALDARTSMDLYATGALGLTSGSALESSGLQASGIGATAGVTATRRFELGGGVQLATVGGLTGGVSQAFDLEVAGATTRDGGLGAYAGVVLGAQVEFKALGGRFAIGPVLELPVLSSGLRSSYGLGTEAYRVSGGRTRSFLTFTF